MTVAKVEKMNLVVAPRHRLIGAEVRGVDLRKPIDAGTLAALHALWMEHLLLIFPAQPITDEQHIAFGRNFDNVNIRRVMHRVTLLGDARPRPAAD